MSDKTAIRADYLDWQSTLSLDEVFGGSDSFAYPHFYQSALIYLTHLKQENSRTVLVLKQGKQSRCITPDGFSLRTKISEYGGKPFWLHGTQLYFVNQDDQCLYSQTLPNVNDVLANKLSKPQRISPKPSAQSVFMYSDVVPVGDHFLLMIIERENRSEKAAENISYIASLDLRSPDQPPQIVESGADFYSNLVVEQSGNNMAWVQWQHPFMPWDNTQLHCGDFSLTDGVPEVKQSHMVDLGAPGCVCQLLFANNGRLFFSADFSSLNLSPNQEAKSDFWNVFSYDLESQNVDRVTNENLEFGYPHWQYGDARIVQFSSEKLIAIGSAPTSDKLFEIDQSSLTVRELEQSEGTIQSLFSDGLGRLAMVLLSSSAHPSLSVLESEHAAELGHDDYSKASALRERVEIQRAFDFDAVSLAQHIDFVGADGDKVYGYYYPPANHGYVCDSPPPLIVLVHGGPTARAYGHFDIQKQFWTSRGFALFDVNHRGSTGYGRAYRDALYGQWGELDTSDIVVGIKALVEQGKADAERICIRGKSAGGYAVLRALTEYPEIFKAGACYYGIGNLVTLAEGTHKFEKYYTDRLIDEAYDSARASLPSSRFYQRSPINKISNLKSAMIIFQGLQDKVVPPEVAKEVVAALKAAKLEHLYVEYADEAHGFRQVNNNVDAWGKELAFYQRVLAH